MLASPSKFGERYFFPSVKEKSPVKIIIAGKTNASPDYIVVIDKCTHTIDYYQFEYVTAGKGYIEINGSVTEVNKGDFFLIKANVPRKIHTDKNDPMEKIYVTIKGAFIESMTSSYGFTSDLEVIHADVSENFEKIIDEANKESRKQVPHADELSDFITTELLKVLQKSYRCFAPQELQSSHRVSEGIAKYISDNLHRKITLRELCDNFFLGETQLIKIFKKTYNDTPLNYAQHLRMSLAKSYLLNSDIDIASLSELLGFSDSGYFAKVFRRYFGTTPLACRKHPESASLLILDKIARK